MTTPLALTISPTAKWRRTAGNAPLGLVCNPGHGGIAAKPLYLHRTDLHGLSPFHCSLTHYSNFALGSTILSVNALASGRWFCYHTVKGGEAVNLGLIVLMAAMVRCLSFVPDAFENGVPEDRTRVFQLSNRETCHRTGGKWIDEAQSTQLKSG
jgi:hypothetical protein